MIKFIELGVVLMIFMGVMGYVVNYSHLLNSLLMLEFISLGIFFFFFLKFSYMVEEVYCLYFLVVVVCESVLGLSLLVLAVWVYSSDYLMSVNVLMC
uniref:NADH-ubiquinone oxidoreductase chain 4L n=1 Tax=Haploginglymus sp. JP-2016 TaxID=1867951 RepID=A0A330IVD2_9CRUS|nr:ND4L [Haploginglymus sp. JP-2016]